jgi:hypothetical protein
MQAQLTHRPLNLIARDIHANWGARKINYAAQPYLNAMSCLRSIDDDYICDSARDIVARFLCNAASWRGPVAKQIKAELNQILKGKK